MPAFAFQRMRENEITQEFESLDVWMSRDCNSVTRKVVCSSLMLKPEKISLASILNVNNISSDFYSSWDNKPFPLSSELYFPSYPSHDICVDYYNKCGAYLEEFNKTSTILGKYVNNVFDYCGKVNQFGIRLFPSDNQTVFTFGVNTSLSKIIDISISTSPAKYLNSRVMSNFITKCPTGIFLINF